MEKKWKQIAEEYDMSPLIHCAAYYAAATDGIEEFIGSNDATCLSCHLNGSSKVVWGFQVGTFTENAETVLKKLDSPEFVETINSKGREAISDLKDYAFFLKHEEFSDYSNERLYDSYEKLFQLAKRAIQLCLD